MKKIIVLVLFTFTTMAAAAFRVVHGEKIVISAPVHEDIYIVGGTVIINAPVFGDLVIAGGTVAINDSVVSDIIVAGGEIAFNGVVMDDLRCAGGNIRINNNVAGDVLISGGTVTIHSNAKVGGLIVGGGNVTVDGNVDGEARITAGRCVLNGQFSKNIDCRGGSITVNGIIKGPSVLSAENIIIGNNAAFFSDVRYWNKTGHLIFGSSLRNCNAVYDPSLQMAAGKWYYLGAATVLGVLWYLGMALLMIFIIQYLFLSSMKVAAEKTSSDTLKSFGAGLLFFIGVPFAAVIACITLVGIPVGLLLLLAYMVLVLLASVITSVVGANWYNIRTGQRWTKLQLVWSAFVLFILIKLFLSVPFLGAVTNAILVCTAFGGIVLAARREAKTA